MQTIWKSSRTPPVQETGYWAFRPSRETTRQMYDVNGRYFMVPLGLVIGACLPVFHWGIKRMFPRTKTWPINTGIIMTSAAGRFGEFPTLLPPCWPGRSHISGSGLAGHGFSTNKIIWSVLHWMEDHNSWPSFSHLQFSVLVEHLISSLLASFTQYVHIPK
jgi:hypothetical protein